MLPSLDHTIQVGLDLEVGISLDQPLQCVLEMDLWPLTFPVGWLQKPFSFESPANVGTIPSGLVSDLWHLGGSHC